MKEVKSIATFLLLQLWVVLLCFSVLFTVSETRESYKAPVPVTGVIEPEEQGTPVAWVEPILPHVTASFVEPAVPPLLQSYGLQPPFMLYLAPKLPGTLSVFTYLLKQFRILPNAP